MSAKIWIAWASELFDFGRHIMPATWNRDEIICLKGKEFSFTFKWIVDIGIVATLNNVVHFAIQRSWWWFCAVPRRARGNADCLRKIGRLCKIEVRVIHIIRIVAACVVCFEIVMNDYLPGLKFFFYLKDPQVETQAVDRHGRKNTLLRRSIQPSKQ